MTTIWTYQNARDVTDSYGELIGRRNTFWGNTAKSRVDSTLESIYDIELPEMKTSVLGHLANSEYFSFLVYFITSWDLASYEENVSYGKKGRVNFLFTSTTEFRHRTGYSIVFVRERKSCDKK